jgi:hypothetical protein
MTEKHHPASSTTSRVRKTRAMRHKDNAAIVETPKFTLPRRFKEATGFARGARKAK